MKMNKIFKSLLLITIIISSCLQAADLELTEITTKNDLYVVYKDQNGKTYFALGDIGPVVKLFNDISGTWVEPTRSLHIFYSQKGRSPFYKTLSLDKVSSVFIPNPPGKIYELKRNTLYQDKKLNLIYDIIPISLIDLTTIRLQYGINLRDDYDFVIIGYPYYGIGNQFVGSNEEYDLSQKYRKVSQSPFRQ